MSAPMDKAWDPRLYDDRHSFVWKAAGDLVERLAPRRSERILDIGCGTGHLTRRIAESGAEVWGIDRSPSMIEQARAAYPQVRFEVADAMALRLDVRFDAVFSNAALHWMTRPGDVLACVHEALVDGGRFVAELGGKGNVGAIYGALADAIRAAGHVPLEQGSLLYFPSVGEYATLLEAHGFRVAEVVHFDRPVPLEGEDAGLAQWIKMFADPFLAAVPDAAQPAVLRAVEERLRPSLFRAGAWHADYRRLRVLAWK